MEFLLFGSINLVFQSMIGLIVLLMIAPLFIQMMLYMLINSINSLIRTDIVPILNIFLFPGAIIRLIFMYLTLTMRGWSPRFAYSTGVGLNAPTNAHTYRRGFTVIMRPPRAGVKLLDIFLFAMGGYFTWVLSIIWAINQIPIVIFLAFSFGVQYAGAIYWGMLLSLLIGGMPVPEETLLPLFFFVSHYPHLAVMLIMGFIGSVMISSTFGPVYGEFYYLMLLMISMVKVWINHQQLSEYKKFINLDGVEQFVIF